MTICCGQLGFYKSYGIKLQNFKLYDDRINNKMNYIKYYKIKKLNTVIHAGIADMSMPITVIRYVKLSISHGLHIINPLFLP